jgi:hypothetical protein
MYVAMLADRVDSNEPWGKQLRDAAVEVTRTVRVRMRNVPLGLLSRDHLREPANEAGTL